MLLALVFAATSHGTWVYKIDGRPLQQADVPKLLAFAKAHQLNELYISVGALPPDAASTPALLKTLKNDGLRVEALIDAPEPAPVIAKVVAYNKAQPAASRFDGVHYDFEPWIGKGNDLSWAPKLAATYKAARTAAGALSFTADISGAKLAQLPPDTRKQVLDAAGRIVAMEYEAPLERVQRRSDGHFGNGARVMLALRVKDFDCETDSAVATLDKTFDAKPGYVGWAIYDYNSYLKRGAQACDR